MARGETSSAPAPARSTEVPARDPTGKREIPQTDHRPRQSWRVASFDAFPLPPITFAPPPQRLRRNEAPARSSKPQLALVGYVHVKPSLQIVGADAELAASLRIALTDGVLRSARSAYVRMRNARPISSRCARLALSGDAERRPIVSFVAPRFTVLVDYQKPEPSVKLSSTCLCAIGDGAVYSAV